uniref:Runt domain-containing protein n=1 Tax=Panagrellus redivivus TaxID=6233 RepID=A0A7E4V2N9_PANRE
MGGTAHAQMNDGMLGMLLGNPVLVWMCRPVLHGEPDFEPKHPNQTNRVASSLPVSMALPPSFSESTHPLNLPPSKLLLSVLHEGHPPGHCPPKKPKLPSSWHRRYFSYSLIETRTAIVVISQQDHFSAVVYCMGEHVITSIYLLLCVLSASPRLENTTKHKSFSFSIIRIFDGFMKD